MTDDVLYSALHWAKKAEYWAGQAAQGQIQSDWAQTDNTKKDFIKNKPDINDLLPSQTGNSGKFLTTNGTASSWATVDALPSQSGQSGKYLTTNGTSASWANIAIPTVNDATLTIQQNGTTVDTFTANSATNKTVNIKTEQFKLFHHDWFDYLLNDQDWLRADTFSWQNGTVYTNAYNHLVADYNGGTSQTETVGSYTITYVLASDGHKITTDETTVANIYNESGVAWYYILDTTNQRFKLPRENPARELLGQSAPIITGEAKSSQNINLGWSAVQPGQPVEFYQNGTVIGGIGTNYGTTGTNNSIPLLADLSKSISVFKGKQYLYFYVGQFSQSATEQTAGLNSELFNGKVDLNAANLSTAGKSLISGFGMPSNTYIDLTLLASGNTYTMPANGYLLLNKEAPSGGQYIYFINTVNQFGIVTISNGGNVRQFMPVKKGDVIEISYDASGATNFFRFIYAEGESSV